MSDPVSYTNLLEPIQVGLGNYLGGYHNSIVPDTQFMAEFAARPLAKSIAWVPGRMVDDVEAIMAEWRKNDQTGKPGLSSLLPAVFVGLAKDYLPILPEGGVAVPPTPIAFPDDPLGRMYLCSTVNNEYKGQIVFVAPERATAHSLVAHFNRWTTQGPLGRRFRCAYTWNGFTSEWPAWLETVDYGAIDAKTEQTNITVLVADLTIRATVPIFTAPKDGQPNDGKAAPAGYPVITDFDLQSFGRIMGAPVTTTTDADGNIINTPGAPASRV